MKPGDHIKVAGFRGVACTYLGPVIEHIWSDEAGRENEIDESRARFHMVGDDRIFEADIENCTPISNDEFCADCGQLGCSHGRYE